MKFIGEEAEARKDRIEHIKHRRDEEGRQTADAQCSCRESLSLARLLFTRPNNLCCLLIVCSDFRSVHTSSRPQKITNIRKATEMIWSTLHCIGEKGLLCSAAARRQRGSARSVFLIGEYPPLPLFLPPSVRPDAVCRSLRAPLGPPAQPPSVRRSP